MLRLQHLLYRKVPHATFNCTGPLSHYIDTLTSRHPPPLYIDTRKQTLLGGVASLYSAASASAIFDVQVQEPYLMRLNCVLLYRERVRL